MTLGQSIKLVRTSAGVKQRQLAMNLGVSSNYVSLLECGKREPSIAFLKRLAKEFEVPVGIFFLWQEFGVKKSDKQNIRKIRDLLTHLEAMYLVSKRS